MRVVVDRDVGHGPNTTATVRGCGSWRCAAVTSGPTPASCSKGRRSEQTFDIPVMTHAIDTGDGVLLWDTGMNARCLEDLAGYLGPAMASTFEPLGDADTLAPARLRQAGFADGDVRWIVNSHLHFDHCGCNSSFASGQVGDPGPGGHVLPEQARTPGVRSGSGRPRPGRSCAVRLRGPARPPRRRIARPARHPWAHTRAPVAARDVHRRAPLRAGRGCRLHPRRHRRRPAPGPSVEP